MLVKTCCSLSMDVDLPSARILLQSPSYMRKGNNELCLVPPHSRYPGSRSLSLARKPGPE